MYLFNAREASLVGTVSKQNMSQYVRPLVCNPNYFVFVCALKELGPQWK